MNGGIGSVAGFHAIGVHAGLKPNGKDLALIFSEVPCSAAVVSTRNVFTAAPIEVSRNRARRGLLQAIVVNSGIANAATGGRGLKDAEGMCDIVGELLGIQSSLVAVASTGVIGKYLPMELLRRGIEQAATGLFRARGEGVAEAIMTTDTQPKEAALRVHVGDFVVKLAAVAKGSGMVAPKMATMLSFVITDASIEPGALRDVIRQSVGMTFNQLDIDGDTSCNDMVIALANGKAGNRKIRKGSKEAADFEHGMVTLLSHITRLMAADGDGASRGIEVEVVGAPNQILAMAVAKSIVRSIRVKAAAYGADPNWGRVMVAAGMVKGLRDLSNVEIAIGSLDERVTLVRGGVAIPHDRERIAELMRGPWVAIRLDLHSGRSKGVSWGCDLTPDYLSINANYEAHLQRKGRQGAEI